MMHKLSHTVFKGRQEGGFTLVEMIVAVFIFTVVMLISVGALVSVMDANRRAQSNKSVMNNLNFALESMTREIRTGKTYTVKEQGGVAFNFIDKDGCGIDYTLSGTQIARSVTVDQKGVCPKKESTLIPLTAPEVTIETLEFYTYGTNASDQEQPHVIIILRGVAGQTERTRVPFNLQAFVTQRFLDRE